MFKTSTMSFLGVSFIFLVSLATGIARHYGHHHKHDGGRRLYPINLNLINGWFQSEISFMVPKNIARYAKNLMDCLPHANAMVPLEDMEALHLTVRTSEAWDNIMDELERSARQMDRSKFSRKWNARPLVELGPGAIKQEVYDFNPDKLGEELKKLVALKKRLDDTKKDLNPEEN